MITLRKFFVGLLALTALVVVAYSVYEMTPERRARRVASRLKRLCDEYFKYPAKEIRHKHLRKRDDELSKELFEVACHCEPPVDPSGPFLEPPRATGLTALKRHTGPSSASSLYLWNEVRNWIAENDERGVFDCRPRISQVH